MESDLYKTPVAKGQDAKYDKTETTESLENRSAKYVLLAIFLTPIVMSMFFVLTEFLFSYAMRLLGANEDPFDIDLMIGLLVFPLWLSFLTSLLIGMPINWFLMKIRKQRLKYFIFVGAVTPLFLTLLSESRDDPAPRVIMGVTIREVGIDPATLLIMSITGAVCLSIFWYIAAFLPTRNRS